MEEFGADFITITDDDGKEYEMEVLSRFEYEGQEYIALTPAGSDDEELSLEVNILRIVVENNEELLEPIADEDDLQTVFDYLMNQVFEEEDE